jgi:fermentation-respiration switch protein FrsA (DUF1100 family)
MNVLLPDLRGHGRSDGVYVGMGYDDSRDLVRWIDWVLEKDPSAQIILHGISMGAATVLMTTGCHLPKQVAAAISDSAYTSAVDVFTHVYKKLDEAVIPAPIMMEAVRAIALVRAGYDIAKVKPVEAVARSQTPTLLFHGQADTFVPHAMGQKIYDAVKDKIDITFFSVPEAEHGLSYLMDNAGYRRLIEDLLDKCLK